MPGLTFFAWSDTHFGYNPEPPDCDIRHQAVRQMAALPGRSYPAELGGFVERPEFVLHCGDVVDGGADPHVALELYSNCMAGLEAPVYEALGNHDAAHPPTKDFFTAGRGTEHYAFECQGVLFVALRQRFDLEEKVLALDQPQLEWLAATVAGAGRPLVLFSHARPDQVPNAESLHSALGRARVLLMLSGHTHLQSVGPGNYRYFWHGRPGVELGHCRNHPIDPDWGRTFCVVRMTGDRIDVAPWRWDVGEWAACQGHGPPRGEHCSLQV